MIVLFPIRCWTDSSISLYLVFLYIPNQEKFKTWFSFINKQEQKLHRDALDEAIIDFAESMNDEVDIDKVSSHQLEALIETYIVNVIQKRLINDIGNNLIELSGSVEEVNKIQEQISDFIQGAVSDSINNVEGGALLDIDSENVSDVVKQIYTEAYDILGSIGED